MEKYHHFLAKTHLNIKDAIVKTLDQDVDVYMFANKNYVVEILPENVCNFDSVNPCLIIEADDGIN